MKGVPDWFIPFVRKVFGSQNEKFWAACAKNGKVTPHPVWEFYAERMVKDRIALLGDAAHMATPQTGAGAYTAMVDSVAFGICMQNSSSFDEGLKKYNDEAVIRAKNLYDRSRSCAVGFAPNGFKMTVSPSTLI